MWDAVNLSSEVFLENLIECSHRPVHAVDAINSVQIGSITIAFR